MAIKVGVIGVGYLGQYHAEKYAHLPEAELVGVMDINLTRAKEVAGRFHCEAFSELPPLLAKVEAISVVVPTQAHYQVAKECLVRGKHVLLEKPMTTTLTEADELIELAGKQGVILQVGHLERFNPAVAALFPHLQNPMFIEAHRLGLSLERGTDVDVILDLMIHDIDIILAAISAKVSEIRAVGVPVVSGNVDIANVRLEFENGCVANLTASRISGKKMRKIRFFQKDAYFSLDYAQRELSIVRREKRGLLPFSHQLLRFKEDDPLRAEIACFLKAIKEKKTPVVSGEDGRRALKIALTINQEIKKRLGKILS
ncbi:MAG: Gfo/Idh/MocA family oxidoreductase [Candidatus Desulfofervidaceae bacterium]|nr:Gfo/Idh/MocA family oxidoreductase [Candidatus Desulfofervidaceae bacterium]